MCVICRPLRWLLSGRGAVLGGLVAMVGCSGDFTTNLTVSEAGPDSTPAMVTIRFRNLTLDAAVDVEFHSSDQPLAMLPDDLFVDDTLRTTSIGVAGSGILQPLDADTIQLPCSDNLTLGTAGGTFKDNDTGDELGRGTPRWIGEQQTGLCGALVTIDFSRSNDEFTTELRIRN